MAISPSRQSVELYLPDIHWVPIEKSTFTFGTTDDVSGWPKISLDSFQISRYPVTNAQYQCFVDDDGYEDVSWWRGLERAEHAPSSWPQTNRPKTDVSWYEAIAFCRWLSERLGYRVTLPTEQQWYRAAAGTDQREYPWGKGDGDVSRRANVDGSGEEGGVELEQTSAVGMYPEGEATESESREGVADLAGNVWEWCLNQYEHPEIIIPDGSDAGRVLRGGCWHDGPGSAVAASRGRDLPGYRGLSIGFRLVCARPLDL